MTTNQVVHVIDDDADVRQSLAFLLSTAGYAVRVHESAVAFLAALPGAQEGCILTDIRMPEMDGLELQRRLKELKARFPVIVMTGHGDVSLAVAAMKAGAVDFLESRSTTRRCSRRSARRSPGTPPIANSGRDRPRCAAAWPGCRPGNARFCRG